MAQTREQKSPSARAPETNEHKSFLSRFSLTRTDKTEVSSGGTRGAKPARQQSRMGKLMFGWLILLLVVEFSSFILEYVSAKFAPGLMTPWFNPKTPVVGALNWSFAVTLLVIVAAYYFLVRFELIPRDLFGNANSARRSQTAAASQPGKPSPDGMGKARRTRAARRHTGTPVAANPHPTARRSAPTKTAATRAAAQPAAASPGGHDDEYTRVKQVQRQLRRREARR